MSLAAKLKSYASSIGFDFLGVTTPDPFNAAAAIFQSRKADGLYPPFTVQNKALRCDPAQILPGCQSVIVGGISYRSQQAESTPGHSPQGWIARYARGIDYHRVLPPLLQQLAGFLQTEVDFTVQYKVNTDTGPLVEKAAAQRAAVGWYGKNSLIYVTGIGSWVVLGALLTNVPLEPDTPTPAPSCGNCNLCSQACPTGAIIAPYVVDSRRCLSYITQMPGQVPLEYRKALGRRVWGCDVCQAACPWNRGVMTEGNVLLGAPAAPPSLVDLLTLSKTAFANHFGNRAMAWRGKATLQRNAAIALGNTGDRTYVPLLARYLHADSKPVLRGACAWALGEIGGPEAEAALQRALQSEIDADALTEIRFALKPAAPPHSVEEHRE